MEQLLVWTKSISSFISHIIHQKREQGAGSIKELYDFKKPREKNRELIMIFGLENYVLIVKLNKTKKQRKNSKFDKVISKSWIPRYA